MKQKSAITVVVPIHNEAQNLTKLITALQKEFAYLPACDMTVILVDDGSTDNSAQHIARLAKKHPFITPVYLARNFGKEVALSAGIAQAAGDAVILMDADLQHPPRYIPKMIEKWHKGAEVVVGVRTTHGKNSVMKSIGSRLFYAILQRISHVKIVPHATDFRLIDRCVVEAYNQFTERNRIVRGLIDWLGFEREYLYFDADERAGGKASYSLRKLLKLATDSFVSMSMVPLKISGYVGVAIMVLSAPLGFFMFLDTYYLGNRYDFSGPASVGVLLLFLVGIILACLGLMSLYIATIHNEVTNRPLYVVRKQPSRRSTTAK